MTRSHVTCSSIADRLSKPQMHLWLRGPTPASRHAANIHSQRPDRPGKRSTCTWSTSRRLERRSDVAISLSSSRPLSHSLLTDGGRYPSSTGQRWEESKRRVSPLHSFASQTAGQTLIHRVSCPSRSISCLHSCLLSCPWTKQASISQRSLPVSEGPEGP